MPANPELPHTQENLTVIEHPDEFPETIQQIQGAKVVQKHFKTQVADDHGTPLTQSPPAQVITTIQPPSDQATLLSNSQGNTSDARTWNAAFWLRIIKKAFKLGWKIIGGSFVHG